MGSMADSMSLLTAQITFLNSQLVLIHIPLKHYSFYLQPILRLLFGEDHDEDAAEIPWTNRHNFFNLTINTLECSIVCSKHLAEKYIVPVQRSLNELFNSKEKNRNNLTIYQETYTVIQVDGQGLDAGQRVLELTGPLAMAGISIFFITTYFCDYILVPSQARQTVTYALEQRGFVFSKENDAFISQLSPSLQNHTRNQSSSTDSSSPYVKQTASPTIPSTPPAKDIDELQSRTFLKLKKFGITPLTDENLRLVSCAGSREPDLKKEERLKNDLLQVLLSSPREAEKESEVQFDDDGSLSHPNDVDLAAMFLSITVTASEPVSILLEERLLPRLGKSLYGAKSVDDILVPITFDLSDLAFQTTGIVGGVAGLLSQNKGRQGSCGSYISEGDLSPGTSMLEKSQPTTEISFLSTARAGTVIVKASQLKQAVKVLSQTLDDTPDTD